MKSQSALRSATPPASYHADDDAARDAARKIEQDNPSWIVVFGIYTRQFVCFPRFRAVPGTVVTALYPPAAVTRMAEIERTCESRGGNGLTTQVQKAQNRDGLRAADEGTGETRS